MLAMLTDFLALSQILTGVEALDAERGRGYLERLTSGPFDPLVLRILERFHKMKGDANIVDRVKKEILAEDDLRPAVCQIILLWYTSAMQDAPGTPLVLRYGTQEEYFSGLAWQIIGAHVPGLSGGYFGHWRYRPENAPKGNV
jgi:hypothetical protein